MGSPLTRRVFQSVAGTWAPTLRGTALHLCLTCSLCPTLASNCIRSCSVTHLSFSALQLPRPRPPQVSAACLCFEACPCSPGPAGPPGGPPRGTVGLSCLLVSSLITATTDSVLSLELSCYELCGWKWFSESISATESSSSSFAT